MLEYAFCRYSSYIGEVLAVADANSNDTRWAIERPYPDAPHLTMDLTTHSIRLYSVTCHRGNPRCGVHTIYFGMACLFNDPRIAARYAAAPKAA
jgi:hypothetical protein